MSANAHAALFVSFGIQSPPMLTGMMADASTRISEKAVMPSAGPD